MNMIAQNPLTLAASLGRAWSQLPDYLGGHVTLTVVALALGILISVPLGVLLTRSPRLRGPALAAAGAIQTVPSLAMLALMVPVLELLGEAGLDSAADTLGLRYSAFGFLPALVALTLYSVLPILRNTVTGILGVDPAATEAARALGMTDLQSLRRVELPLALPVIVAGIRTSAVWTVGIATLSTPVGQVSLGNYIFSGLQTRNTAVLLFGVAWAAGLALVIDLLLGRVAAGLERRRPTAARLAVLALGLVLLAGLLAPLVTGWASADRGETAADALAADPSDASLGAALAQRRQAREADVKRLAADAAATLGPIRIGSKTFTEQYILARALENRLQRFGFATERVDSLGSTVAFQQLVAGELDVYVDYTGTIWANHMQRTGTAPPGEVLEAVAFYMSDTHNARSLGSLGFENAYAFAMRRDQAERLGIESIYDLREHAGELTIGGDYEWFSRPEWAAVQSAYGLNFAAERSFDPSLMYEAVRAGDADVITAFSSDGRIEAFDLTVLSDPLAALPPYDATLLLGPRVAGSDAVVGALSGMVGTIDLATMQRINAIVDVRGQTLDDAAAALGDTVEGR